MKLFYCHQNKLNSTSTNNGWHVCAISNLYINLQTFNINSPKFLGLFSFLKMVIQLVSIKISAKLLNPLNQFNREKFVFAFIPVIETSKH